MSILFPQLVLCLCASPPPALPPKEKEEASDAEPAIIDVDDLDGFIFDPERALEGSGKE